MKNNRAFAFLMIVPATVSILMVCIYPVLNGIYLSFTDFNILNIKNVKFIGLMNFVEIFLHDKEFWSVISFTFVFVIGTVVLSYFTGLLAAVIMNQDIKGKSIFRAFLLVPWVIPNVVAANSWLWILNDQTGVINIFLVKLGVIKSPVLFLAEPAMAQLTVILVSAWKSFPFMMLVLLAGLQNISKEIYESAHIDGAGRWKSFVYITLPNLKPVTMTSTILMSLWTFNNFESIYLMTKGGPANATEVISIFSYYTAFFRNRLGYSSAISTVMMFIMLIMSQLYMKVLKKNEN